MIKNKLFESIFKVSNSFRESIDWTDWWKQLPPELKKFNSWKKTYDYMSQDYYNSEDWTESKEYDIRSDFLSMYIRYFGHKLKNETKEMLEVAEELYKFFTDSVFFIKKAYIKNEEDYRELYRRVHQPRFKPAEFLEELKLNYAHPKEGDYDWTYDHFVSETLPEIKELLGK